MFTLDLATQALKLVEDTLIGSLGMKTLDPTDWNYRPVYDMSNQTTDFATAKGFNYHNGPVSFTLNLICVGMGVAIRLFFACQALL